jgi:condensation domain-containing protein/phosphopantetheine binding protein
LDEIYVAARTQTEKELARMFATILGVTQVGLHDNFFELGGHSLLATQLLARIRETFVEKDISLRQIFETPTVAGLAGEIEASGTADQVLPPLLPVPREQELPLSFAQQRFWYLDRLHPGNPAYNSSALLRVTGYLNVPALAQAFNEIVQRHESLRTIFPEVNGLPKQVILSEQSITLRIADLRGLSSTDAQATQQRLTANEAKRSFDLSKGPLTRATLTRLDEREHLVVVTMHHIVGDGWSNDLFYQELLSLYSSYSDGQPSTLSVLPVQYADFAHWQREQLQGPRLSAQRAYWQEQLKDAPSPLTLSDHPLPLHVPRVARTHSFSLHTSMPDRLRRFTREAGVTLFSTLMAGFAALLHCYTGQEDIIVGTPISNRDRKETEGLIGCLINTLALRVDLSGNPSFAELVQRVQTVMLSAQAHKEVPYELVVESLPRSGTVRHRTLFRHWFVLLQSVGSLTAGPARDLKLEVEEVGGAGAQFELTLMIREAEKTLRCTLTYVAGEISSEDVQAFAADYEAILAAALAQPEAGILELPWTKGQQAYVGASAI